jgi:hypothetical protein
MISTYKLLLELCSKIQDYELKVCIVYQLTGSAFCAFLLDLEVREEGLLCLDPFGNFCHNIFVQSVEAVICKSFAWIATIFSTLERHQFFSRR